MKPSHWTALAIYLFDAHRGADEDYLFACAALLIAVVMAVWNVLGRKQSEP